MFVVNLALYSGFLQRQPTVILCVVHRHIHVTVVHTHVTVRGRAPSLGGPGWARGGRERQRERELYKNKLSRGGRRDAGVEWVSRQ